jgi:hypothetical protein
MKFGNEFWLILFREYISPNLFAVRRDGILFFLVSGGGKKPIMLMQTVFWITWPALTVLKVRVLFKLSKSFKIMLDVLGTNWNYNNIRSDFFIS